jgi:hypothetical protein
LGHASDTVALVPAIPNPLEIFTRQAEALADAINSVLDPARQLAYAAPRALERLEAIERRADRLIELGETVTAQADRVITLAESLDEKSTRMLNSGDAMMHEAQRMIEQAVEVNARAAELIAALPLVEQGLAMVRPLEGAVERLGRIADRMPGGTKR